MIRINLLPKEIQEKRRYEGYFIWIYIAGAVLGIAILGTWLMLGLQIQSKNRDLQSRLELANRLKTEADSYAVFEQKQAALTSKQAVAKQALDGRINWAKVSNEISLVLPADVWTTGFSASQDTGVELTLVARDVKDAPDVGQKSVARAMVRLNNLESLYNVWLKSSSRADPVLNTTVGTINFQLSAAVVKPVSTSAGTPAGASAPPATSGQ